MTSCLHPGGAVGLGGRMAAARRAWECQCCNMPGNHAGKKARFSWISSPAPARPLREQQHHPEGRGREEPEHPLRRCQRCQEQPAVPPCAGTAGLGKNPISIMRWMGDGTAGLAKNPISITRWMGDSTAGLGKNPHFHQPRWMGAGTAGMGGWERGEQQSRGQLNPPGPWGQPWSGTEGTMQLTQVALAAETLPLCGVLLPVFA